MLRFISHQILSQSLNHFCAINNNDKNNSLKLNGLNDKMVKIKVNCDPQLYS